MSSQELGWSDFFASQIENDDSGLTPARVTRQDLNRYHLITESGETQAVLPGRMRSYSRAELPTVGDWVLLAESTGDDPDVIQRTLDRRSKFSRKAAGTETEEQVIAANIDTVFIVTGLDDNFNPSRIERYLVLAWDSGTNPVIVMNKTDLCDDVDEKLELVSNVAMGVPIHAVSGETGDGLDEILQYLGAGMTAAFLGSSGVGKSTLINSLLGVDHFETGAVREGDSKGRHTTTHREMCLIAGKGLIIDTPGMREIQLWSDDDSTAAGFTDVEQVAIGCRFADCKHRSEPGCAVQAAIGAGTLDAARLDSFRKYQRELAHLMARQDAVKRVESKKARRKFAKLVRKRPSKRDGDW